MTNPMVRLKVDTLRTAVLENPDDSGSDAESLAVGQRVELLRERQRHQREELNARRHLEHDARMDEDP